ncbi:hypothetical protein RCC30_19755 [Pseudomonas fluorescens]|nr:hypothetical protein RCC30_19755 [Pseudomonas fluorescens]
MIKPTFKRFHMCCELGSGAAGFSDSKPTLGSVQAESQYLGGVDVDPAGLHGSQMMTGLSGTLMDLLTREQFTALNGQDLPSERKEATFNNMRRAASKEDPNALAGLTLLPLEKGQTFIFSKVSIWVQPVAIALSASTKTEEL